MDVEPKMLENMMARLLLCLKKSSTPFVSERRRLPARRYSKSLFTIKIYSPWKAKS